MFVMSTLEDDKDGTKNVDLLSGKVCMGYPLPSKVHYILWDMIHEVLKRGKTETSYS